MIEIVNLQRKIKLEKAVFERFAGSLRDSSEEFFGKGFTIAFISDGRMKKLNSFFRSKGDTTDVLSFPHAPGDFDPDMNNIGDIVISIEQAQRQADENGLTLETEIKQLILHGILHLCGYDHETDNGEMNKRELALRDKLAI